MKKVKYIIVTIFLGALGSAFWETGLKKFFLLIINSIMPYLSQCFSDSFYTQVTRSLNAPASETYFFIIIILELLIIVPPSFLSKIFYSYSGNKKDRIIQSVLKVACLFIVLYNFFTIEFSSNIARNTLSNIEIVAPYITDMEYKQLRSDFFQMDSKSDYENLVKKISSIVESNQLQIK